MNHNKLLIIGDANIDIIINGLKNMPEMGQEIFVDNIFVRAGGGAANTAAGLAKLGCNPTLYSAVGNDQHGKFIERTLKSAGVELSLLRVHETLPTGISVSISDGSDRMFISSMGANPEIEPTSIDEKTLSQFSHIHLSAWNPKLSLKQYKETAKRARQLGCTVSLDIGWTDESWNHDELFDLLKETDIFFPNLSEARCLCWPTATEDQMGQYLLSYVNDVVVITKGSDGAVAYHKKEKYSDKYVTKAIDSVGAGDAFNAGFLSAYVHKLPIEVCLSYGCACGSAAVQKVGGGIPMSWEILTASVKDHMTKRGSTSNF